ncbi:MAG: thiamine-monophosphate kinase [Candidatus Eremiobacteraeota bacterium]|jgi:thiamine-monophosphate kinase|nr:thiamine-monophosphate kinase [Candidatus Eremiobacteraeota bacterium]
MSGDAGRSEDALVAAIRERLHGVPGERLLVGIGDDAAVWQPSHGNRAVITTDALVEGVHFTRDAMSARDAGHRALAANLSDVAAMGARPVLATVALGFPPETETAWLLEAYDGIAALAERARCAIGGGDLTRAPAIVFAITVVGEVRASNLKTRAGARPGDVVAVTGRLGASAAGLLIAAGRPELAAEPELAEALAAYRTPEPRLREGRWLAGSRHVRAMMDTSDGLSTDLGRLCAASGVGAIIDTVPVHDAARRVAARTGDDAERWGLDGGEDFELLVAVEKRAFGYLAARFRAHTGRELVRVGSVTAGSGVRLADGTAVRSGGWDHLRR